LAEALISREIEGAIAAIVQAGNNDRAAVGHAEFNADEGRDALRLGDGLAIERIARIAALRRNSKTEPCRALVPDWVRMSVNPAAPFGAGHGAGGEQQRLAEVAGFVEQREHVTGRKFQNGRGDAPVARAAGKRQ
jgi:hypothetical protein